MIEAVSVLECFVKDVREQIRRTKIAPFSQWQIRLEYRPLSLWRRCWIFSVFEYNRYEQPCSGVLQKRDII